MESLRLTFDDERPDGSSAQRYAQPVLVQSAKAHFEVRCMVPRCDGLHDLTTQIVRVLRERKTEASIRSQCQGSINNTPCVSTLICTCEAAYRG
ncbi:MAG TPA: hypothetical protein VJR89_33420 [Polyangiales bacterium]|nr:hypothetical protein [Polyangiales bacterium]